MAKTEVDKDLIRELAALMDETGLCEIEIGSDERRMRLVRPSTTKSTEAALLATIQSSQTASLGSVSPQGSALSSQTGAVTSPLVGTAYYAPSPEASPFVNVGDKVSEGQTLLVIEAMKTFNEIPAPNSGVVKEILFENAAPVEFGDVLMIVD